MNKQQRADLIVLLGVCIVLSAAFYYQLVLGELPCALCNLQRVAFMIFGAGLLLNLRSGVHPFNYFLSAAGAMTGGLVALLQMFVHVLPGTPPTGTAFLGLHLYTLSYMLFIAAVLYCVVLLSVQTPWPLPAAKGQTARYALPQRLVAALFCLLIAGNLLSALLENGFHPFRAGGQQHYEMLHDGDPMQP
jgi:disulfide bond formation protein DsbB